MPGGLFTIICRISQRYARLVSYMKHWDLKIVIMYFSFFTLAWARVYRVWCWVRRLVNICLHMLIPNHSKFKEISPLNTQMNELLTARICYLCSFPEEIQKSLIYNLFTYFSKILVMLKSNRLSFRNPLIV